MVLPATRCPTTRRARLILACDTRSSANSRSRVAASVSFSVCRRNATLHLGPRGVCSTLNASARLLVVPNRFPPCGWSAPLQVAQSCARLSTTYRDQPITQRITRVCGKEPDTPQTGPDPMPHITHKLANQFCSVHTGPKHRHKFTGRLTTTRTVRVIHRPAVPRGSSTTRRHSRPGTHPRSPSNRHQTHSTDRWVAHPVPTRRSRTVTRCEAYAEGCR